MCSSSYLKPINVIIRLNLKIISIETICVHLYNSKQKNTIESYKNCSYSKYLKDFIIFFHFLIVVNGLKYMY